MRVSGMDSSFIPLLGIPLLGAPKDDPAVAALLERCGAKPKTDSASNKALGVEFGFERAGLLDTQPRAYKSPNVRVLSAIFLWTDKATWAGRVKTFTGTLPHGLRWGMSRLELLQCLGAPAREGDFGSRWDFADHCLFTTVREDGGLIAITLQLPVEDYRIDLPDPLYFETAPADPPDKARLVAGAFLVAWGTLRVGPSPKHAGLAHTADLAAHKLTPRQFLQVACAETLTKSDFAPALWPFLSGYLQRGFLGDKPRRGAKRIQKLLGLEGADEIAFDDDYLGTFRKPVVPDPFLVPDCWEAFDRFAPILDARWADYQATEFKDEPPRGLYEKAVELRDAVNLSVTSPAPVPVAVDADLTDSLLRIVGLALTDRDVKEVLARAMLPIGKRIDEQAAPKLGISYLGSKFEVGGKRVLGVKDVRFYAEGVATFIRGLGMEVRFAGYTGGLPRGLRFGDSRAEVVKKLGRPVDPDRELDTWWWKQEKSTRVLTCRFERGKLREVGWSLPDEA